MTPTSHARPLLAAATLAAAALLQAAGAFAQDIAAGERKAIAAKPLSDDDIRDLAA